MEKKFRINELGVSVEITNRYFFIEASDVNLDSILNVIVGTLDEQRYSLDNTKIVVKLHDGDYSDYAFLAIYPEYNHEQVLIELQSAEWTMEL